MFTSGTIYGKSLMTVFGGYIFDKKAPYSFTTWNIRGGVVNRRSRQHWLAIQQGSHANRRLQLAFRAAAH